jgi:hypothetical protein
MMARRAAQANTAKERLTEIVLSASIHPAPGHLGALPVALFDR